MKRAMDDVTLALLRKKDSDHAGLRRDILAMPPRIWKIRWACANLISSMAHTNSQSPAAYHVAIEILDRYIASGVTLPALDPGDGLLELSGVILVLASKITEMNTVGIAELERFCGFRPRSTLLTLELEIANRIGFVFPTPGLEYFLADLIAGDCPDPSEASIAQLLSEIAIGSPDLLHLPPLILLAASVHLAKIIAGTVCQPNPAVTLAAIKLASVAKAVRFDTCLMLQHFPRGIVDLVVEQDGMTM